MTKLSFIGGNVQIHELSQLTGVPAKTIRYYEEIELLPPAARKPNGYREYNQTDVERLKLVAGARRLDFSLSEIKEILDLRERNIAPCNVLLDLLNQKVMGINQRIAELQKMQQDLKELYSLGKTFPTDDVAGKHCVCHLISKHQN